MILLILAGGFGTRLRSAIGEIPKPLAPIGGKPFLDFVLEPVLEGGQFKQVVFLVHHLQQKMVDYIEEKKKGFLQNYLVSWIYEEIPLGTGGSVMNAVRSLGTPDSFFVLNADTYLSPDLNPIFRSKPNAMGVVKVFDTSRYGLVEFDENLEIHKFGEKICNKKWGWINSGFYHLSSGIFEGMKIEPFSMENRVFPKLADKRFLKACPLESTFIDIGIPSDYERFGKWVESGMRGAL